MIDQISFSKDKESLNRMREAEIKHCRLAMLGKKNSFIFICDIIWDVMWCDVMQCDVMWYVKI